MKTRLARWPDKQLSPIRGPDLHKSPWFEILLFRSVLRFRNPHSSVKLPKNIDGRAIDERPFVNTLSKEKYYTGDDAGRYLFGFYATAWGFFSRRLFARPLVTLKLTVNVVAVIKPELQQFSDMYDPEIAIPWLRHSFRNQQAFFNELNFTKMESGDLKVELREKSDAQAMANITNHEPETCYINGQIAYRVQSFPNQLDVFFPFTNQDLVQFTFTLIASQNISDQQKAEFTHKANEFSDAIIKTVTISHPDTCLGND